MPVVLWLSACPGDIMHPRAFPQERGGSGYWVQLLHAMLKLGQMWVPYLPAPGLEVGFSHCPSSAGSYWPHSCLQVSWKSCSREQSCWHHCSALGHLGGSGPAPSSLKHPSVPTLPLAWAMRGQEFLRSPGAAMPPGCASGASDPQSWHSCWSRDTCTPVTGPPASHLQHQLVPLGLPTVLLGQNPSVPEGFAAHSSPSRPFEGCEQGDTSL